MPKISRRKLLIISTIFAGVLAMVVAMVWPRQYGHYNMCTNQCGQTSSNEATDTIITERGIPFVWQHTIRIAGGETATVDTDTVYKIPGFALDLIVWVFLLSLTAKGIEASWVYLKR